MPAAERGRKSSYTIGSGCRMPAWTSAAHVPLLEGRSLLRRDLAGRDSGVHPEREEAETRPAQVTLRRGQALTPHLRRHVGATEVRVLGQTAVHRGDQLVVALPAFRGERDAAGLDLAEPDP